MNTLNRIHRTEQFFDSARFDEWTRTQSGGTAAVSCTAREERDGALYAYAYVHAILTLVRRYPCEKIAMLPPREMAELLLEKCRRAAERLDAALSAPAAAHAMPHIAGFFTVGRRAVLFAAGNAAIAVDEGGRQTDFAPYGLQRRLAGRGRLAGTRAGALHMRLEVRDIARAEGLTLWTGGGQADGRGVFRVDLQRPPAASDARSLRAVLTGREHSAAGRCCQDFGDVRVYGDGGFAAALSDGAGGGRCSEYGARLNVSAFLDCAQAEIPPDRLAADVLKAVEERHERLQRGRPEGAIEAYATLMGVSIHGGSIVYVHIGDGAIFARRKDGTTVCLSDADNGGASNRTFFTIEPDAARHMVAGRADRADFDGLLLVTDGVYNAFEGERRPDFVGGIFDAAAAPDFDEMRLAKLTDGDEITRWGDDHSSILVALL